MILFGNTDKFYIQYLPYREKYHEHPDVISDPDSFVLGGSVFFWVNKKNIFAYKDLGPEATYSFGDLSILTELFCDFLFYHITEDPFPAETKSKTGWTMMEEMKLVEGPDNDITKYLDVDWDKVDEKLYSEIHSWNCRHGFLINSGGTFLPDIYAQKVNDKVEISWCNDFPFRSTGGVFYAEHKEGVEYVDIKLYRDTVVAFCQEFLNRLEKIYPKKADELRINLQKAIDVPL